MLNVPHVVLETHASGAQPGEVVEGGRVTRLRDKGAAMLPVSPDLLARGALWGLALRQMGRGNPVPHAVQGYAAQLAMMLAPERPRLHWAARLRLEGEVQLPLAGRLYLVADSSQPPAQGGAVSSVGRTQVDLAEVQFGERGEALLLGEAEARPWGDILVGLALAGLCQVPGVRVVWFAVTQTQ